MVRIGLPGRPELRGTLSPRFAELPDLQCLSLEDTQVSGDVATLKNLRELETLYLRDTKVFVDLAALKNLTKLKGLNLEHAQVSGDVAALKNLRELRYLDLYGTNVAGDIAALKNLRELKWLVLVNTNVIGDMAALENATSLGNNFYIDGTKITCQDAALRTVLLKLGLEAEQLTDLMNFRGVKRMLSCRNMKGRVLFFAHDFRGSN